MTATDDIQSLIQASAERHHVDPDLALAVARQESSFNPKAIGRRTPYGRAQGVFQLIPKTARQYGVTDPLDARQNIEGGVRYLADLSTKHKGDRRKMLIEFNSGPENVDKPNQQLPRETEDYLSKILGHASAELDSNQLGQLLRSPKFRQLSGPEKLKVWSQADSKFAAQPLRVQAETMIKLLHPGSRNKPLNPEDPGILATLGEAGKGFIQTGKMLFTHPIELSKNLAGAQLSEGQKALEAAKEGRRSEAFGHGLAAITPLAGPLAAKSGEDIGEGRTRQGLTEAGLVLAPEAYRALPTPVRAIPGRVARSISAGLPGSGLFRAAIEKWRSLSPAAKTQAARNEYLDAVAKELKKKPFEKLNQAEKTEVVRQADALPDIARREMELRQASPAQPGRARQAARQAREQLARKTAPEAAKPAEPIPADIAAEQAKREARKSRLKETLPAPGETKLPTSETKPPKTETPIEKSYHEERSKEHGEFVKQQGIAKDARIVRFLRSKGYTPDRLDGMTASDWKKVIQDVNEAYGTRHETKTQSIDRLMNPKRIKEFKRALQEEAPPSPAGTEFPKTSEVLMRAPTGQTQHVPAGDVEHYRSRGAEVVEENA